MRWLLALGVVAGCWPGCSSEPPASMIDAASDSAADPCAACAAGERCIARYDGTCRLSIACVAPVAACADNTCSAACETAYCAPSYQCHTRSPCGGEPATAFTCYGP
jgi:hypothetical protein